MTYERCLELLCIEIQCIQRNETKLCDRHCEKCDLVQNTSELLMAYYTAVGCVADKLNQTTNSQEANNECSNKKDWRR